MHKLHNCRFPLITKDMLFSNKTISHRGKQITYFAHLSHPAFVLLEYDECKRFTVDNELLLPTCESRKRFFVIIEIPCATT